MNIHKLVKKILLIIIIMILTFYISNSWFQITLIHGDSMEPSYHSWQFVLLSKNSQALSSGDVVAFYSEKLDTILVKRIVACPGDSLCIKSGTLYVNGAQCENIYFNGSISYYGIASELITLGKNEYFMLGDNHANSKDSRYVEIGLITRDDIIGRIIPQKKIIF